MWRRGGRWRADPTTHSSPGGAWRHRSVGQVSGQVTSRSLLPVGCGRGRGPCPRLANEEPFTCGDLLPLSGAKISAELYRQTAVFTPTSLPSLPSLPSSTVNMSASSFWTGTGTRSRESRAR